MSTKNLNSCFTRICNNLRNGAIGTKLEKEKTSWSFLIHFGCKRVREGGSALPARRPKLSNNLALKSCNNYFNIYSSCLPCSRLDPSKSVFSMRRIQQMNRWYLQYNNQIKSASFLILHSTVFSEILMGEFGNGKTEICTKDCRILMAILYKHIPNLRWSIQVQS